MTKVIEITPEYLESQGLSSTFPKRFWAKVDKKGPNDCWIWNAALSGKGYGMINKGPRGAKLIIASRAVWILCNGPIPEGMDVLHKCPIKHNPACCNPAHLSLGQDPENGRDSVLQGTNYFENNKTFFGEHHANHKMSTEQIQELLRNYTGKRGEQSAAARKYGVTRTCICDILHGRSRVRG